MAKERKFFGASLKVVTKHFFDRAKVLNAMDRKTNAAMNYIGASLRKTARQSIRKSTGRTPHSMPGQPVRSSTGVYKNTILYEYDPKKKTVICGPKKLPIKTNVRPVSRVSVPELLEKGGVARATKPSYVFRPGKKAKTRKQKRVSMFETIPAGIRKYKPRPTMLLAWRKTINNQRLQTAFGVIGLNKR